MWIGIAIGLAITIIISLTSEYRVINERREQHKLLKLYHDKCDELKKTEVKLQKAIDVTEEMRVATKELALVGGRMAHDYAIVVGLLEDAVGKERANELYLEKKNQPVTDLNDLIKDIQARKGE